MVLKMNLMRSKKIRQQLNLVAFQKTVSVTGIKGAKSSRSGRYICAIFSAIFWGQICICAFQIAFCISDWPACSQLLPTSASSNSMCWEWASYIWSYQFDIRFQWYCVFNIVVKYFWMSIQNWCKKSSDFSDVPSYESAEKLCTFFRPCTAKG